MMVFAAGVHGKTSNLMFVVNVLMTFVDMHLSGPCSVRGWASTGGLYGYSKYSVFGVFWQVLSLAKAFWQFEMGGIR